MSAGLRPGRRMAGWYVKKQGMSAMAVLHWEVERILGWPRPLGKELMDWPWCLKAEAREERPVTVVVADLPQQNRTTLS